MKKLIALLLALVMVLGLGACGKKETPATEDGNTPPALESTPVEEAVPDFLSHQFTQYGNAKITIVGEEFTQDDYGEDLLRIYYDYTNTDTTANGHHPSTVLDFVSITQDGNDCDTYLVSPSDEFIVPEDLNNANYIQPGCTNRNTFLIACDPNGGNVKVSCYLMIGGWVYNENEVEPFEFEIDTKNLMGAPEPYVLPAITDPKYTANMSASGPIDYPLDAEVSIDGIELTRDYDGKDVLRVKLTVTNNGDEALAPMTICLMELYQDGVSLPWASTWDMDYDDITPEDEAYEEELEPGETVQCNALFYPRNQNPAEAVIENVNGDLCLGTCFDVKAVYDAVAAEENAAAAANAEAAAAATAADKEAIQVLLGYWDRTDSWPDHLTFNDDFTGIHDMTGDEFPFTYAVKDCILTLYYDDGEELSFLVEPNGDNLTLTDTDWGDVQTFVRHGSDAEVPEENKAPEETKTAADEVNWAEFLIGTWVEHESGYYETFTFEADGTGLYSYYEDGLWEYPFTYEIRDDDSVALYYDDGDVGGFWIEIVDQNTILVTNTTVTDCVLIRE